jgi:triosephosphate isomerase
VTGVQTCALPILFAQTDVDGGLIGGASLQAQDFVAICKAARAR